MTLRKDNCYSAVGKNGSYAGETAKAHSRRLRENWYSKFAPPELSGIDIGCGIDPINDTFYKWDSIYGDGDVTFMDGVPDESFHTVYCSHVLEHLQDPVEAVKNWWRILKPGGHLIICVPHRDLYEQKKELPSNWNSDHKWFWLPQNFEPPYTLSLAHIVGKGTERDFVLVRVLNEGYNGVGLESHPSGEYSIETIVKK